MAVNSVVILLILSLCAPRVTGTVSGTVLRWIEETFCTAAGAEYRTLPWDCFGYLHCEQSSPAHWSNCGRGEKFDMTTLKCQAVSTTCQDPEMAAYTYCPTHPDLKFAHPKSCARYYDCSVTNPKPGLKKYENECTFPALFDHVNAVCRPHTEQNPIPCTNIPASKCDYVLNNSPDCKSAACAGLADGLHIDPLTMADYFPRVIKCSLGKVTESYTCTGINEVFDVANRTCTTNHKLAIKNFCIQFPLAKFADPDNCAMYYDCSAIKHHTVPSEDYLTECKYIHLFDIKTRTCQRYNELVTPCGARKIPIKPCEYRFSDCQAERPCFPCSAICVGLPDGANPYPGYKNTRFYLICEGQRTLYYKQCVSPQIFLPGKRVCGKRGEDIQDSTDGTENCVGSRPTCAADLKIFQEDINELFAKTDALNKEVNKKNPDPYECLTPPKVTNSIYQLSYTPDSAQATYQCIDGYTTCGGELSSTCSSLNTWSDITGSCVQSVWTEVLPVTNFKCPFKEGAVLSLRGRYTGDKYGFRLHVDTSEVPVFVANVSPGPNNADIMVKWALDDFQKVVPIFRLHNAHEWTITVNKDKVALALNGRHMIDFPHGLLLANDLFNLVIESAFKAERLEFHQGGMPSDEKYSLSINLAYNQPATSSSSTSTVTPSHATDGDHGIVWSEDHCWSSKAGDSNPWWTVDLGQTFVVSHLVITTPDCASCGSLGDYTIHVSMMNNRLQLKDDHLCHEYVGDMPAKDVTKVECDRPLIGRYVTIQRTKGSENMMAFCEVEVYGGRVPPTGWQPSMCPHPPVMAHSTVQVGYTPTAAVATYTCHDNYGNCGEEITIRCNSERGWDTKPRPCIKMTRFPVLESVKFFPICPLHLGSGIEFWFTAKSDRDYIAIEDSDDDNPLSILLMNLASAEKPTIILGQVVKPSPITKDKEHHMVISVLSPYILVEIDGETVAKLEKYSAKQNLELDYLLFSKTMFVRKARLHDRIFGTSVVRYKPEYRRNIAVGHPALSSSNYNNLPSVAFDYDEGEYNPDWGSCWHAAIGDQTPWLQVDLEGTYFIKDITVRLWNYKKGRGSKNIAESKPAVGSADADAKSSPANAVDGNSESDYTKGSCFATTAAESWWMVDLQGSFLIEEVVLQGQTDANADKFKDIAILIYDKDPETDTSATETVCMKKDGQLDPTQKLTCTESIRGRFVKVKKTGTGLTLCEVQVYAELRDRLHNFEIRVSETIDDTPGKLCYKHEGEVTGYHKKISCYEEIKGKYVRISGPVPQTEDDLMTVCELEVYGDQIVKTPWTPQACPTPPKMFSGDYVVTYTSQKAMVKYFCKENYTMFEQLDTMNCTSYDGWTGRLGNCKKTTLYHNKHARYYIFRPFQVGEAYVFMFTPTSPSWILKMTNHPTSTRRLEISSDLDERHPRSTSLEVALKAGVSAVFNRVVRKVPFFKLNTEVKITVTFLTDVFDIAVNDIYVMSVQSPKIENDLKRIDYTGGIVRIFHHLEISRTVAVKEPVLKALLDDDSDTSSSSEYGPDFKDSFAVDGTLLEETSKCWMAKEDDTDPWLDVELNSHSYVDHVVVTSKSHCSGEDAEACAKRTHDILVEVYHEDYPRQKPMLCAYRKGVIPSGVSEIIPCQAGARGRHVRLTGKERHAKSDMFTLCEVQVYGGSFVRYALTQFKNCPKPPVIENAEVSVTHTLTEAVARYTCHDGFTACGSSTKRCDGIHGWDDMKLGFECVQSTFYEPDKAGLEGVEIPCAFRLGRALELYFTRETTGSLVFEGAGVILRMTMDANSITLSRKTPPANIVKVNDVPFVGGKEVKIVIIFMSEYLDISVDGKLVKMYDMPEEPSSLKTITVGSGRLRMVRVVEASNSVAIKYSIPDNLATGSTVTARITATGSEAAAVLVDGKLDTFWTSRVGYSQPSVMIQFPDNKYYYTEHLILTTRPCTGECDDGIYDILVTGFHDSSGENHEVCIYHKGDIMPETRTKLVCQNELRGQYIMLQGKNRAENDALTFAEIEIFGGEISREPWTPAKCPKAPLMPNAVVSVACKENEAVATYKCVDDYTRCGEDTHLRCTGYDGWKGTTGQCVQYIFRSRSTEGLTNAVLPCMFRLGDAIEVVFEATSPTSALQFEDDMGNVIFGMALSGISSLQAESKIALSSYKGSTRVTHVELDGVTFYRNNPKRIVVTFMTTYFDVTFEGRHLATFEHKIEPSLITTVAGLGTLYYVKWIKSSEAIGEYSPLSENLALAYDAVTSSSDGGTGKEPENAVDGNLLQLVADGATCFQTSGSDQKPSFTVKLDDYYQIDRIVIWSEDCSDACGGRLHHISATVHHKDPSDELSDERVQWCIYREDLIPPNTHMSFSCDARGRYVTINAFNPLEGEGLGFCELQIFGGKISRKPYPPFDCPKPTLFPYTEVSVSYTATQAKASYRCSDGFSRCDLGSDTSDSNLFCSGYDGWKGVLGDCVPTTLIEDDVKGVSPPIILPCLFHLGQALELFVTPLEDSVSIAFVGADWLTFQIEIFQTTPNKMILKADHIGSTTPGSMVVENVNYPKGKEIRVVVTFLTGGIDLEIDGAFIAMYDIGSDPATMRTVFVDGVRMRMTQYVPVSQSIAVPRAQVASLGTDVADVTASTTDTSHGGPNVVVDGNLAMTLASKSCWMALTDDKTPYVLIELNDYYYIDYIEITTRGDAGSCSGDCAERAHDIEVTVFHAEEDVPQLCNYRDGIIPAGTTEQIKCKSRLRGRFVKVEGKKRKDGNDLLTLCEVGIFGGQMVREKADAPPTIPLDPCPTGDGYISVESPRLCFKLSDKTDTKTYDAASAACSPPESGRLINLDTAEKHLYIVNHLTNMGDAAGDAVSANFRMWVGMKKNAADTPQWASRSFFGHQWETGEPDPGTSDKCIQLLKAGLSDIPCAETRRYICEVPMLAAEAPPAPPPTTTPTPPPPTTSPE